MEEKEVLTIIENSAVEFETAEKEVPVVAPQETETGGLPVSEINRLIIENTRLIWWVINRRFDLPRELKDDAFQEGVLGLRRGIERFDSSKGYKFSTYIGCWIYGYIVLFLRNQKSVVRLRQRTFDMFKKISDTQKRLEQETGTAVARDEIMKATGISDAYYQTYAVSSISTETPVSKKESDDETLTLGGVLESATHSPENVQYALWIRQLRAAFEKIFSSFPPKERIIIQARFGLLPREYDQDQTLDAIGKRLGLTRERVRQIEARVIRHLRKPRWRKIVEPFYREL